MRRSHVTNFLNTLWGLLWSITVQIHDNMEYIYFLCDKEQNVINGDVMYASVLS